MSRGIPLSSFDRTQARAAIARLASGNAPSATTPALNLGECHHSMNANQKSIAGFNRMSAYFNRENALATLSASALPAEPARPLSNVQILRILLDRGDHVTTFASAAPFTGFRFGGHILRLV